MLASYLDLVQPDVRHDDEHGVLVLQLYLLQLGRTFHTDRATPTKEVDVPEYCPVKEIKLSCSSQALHNDMAAPTKEIDVPKYSPVNRD